MSEVRSTRFRDRMMTYLELTKPRLMWLLCLLALAGMGLAVATGAELDGVTVVATTLGGGVLAIGASGTFNHVYERDRDRKMRRTADRPIATDRVGVRRATGFGVALVIASMAVLVAFVNVLTAALTVAAIVYYAYVYTVLLKPTTRWNTVIGGGSGALPALIGYAAVTGTVGLPAVLLALVVCCWTPAHFYNLAIAHREGLRAGRVSHVTGRRRCADRTPAYSRLARDHADRRGVVGNRYRPRYPLCAHHHDTRSGVRS